jgi:hypothetical protein
MPQRQRGKSIRAILESFVPRLSIALVFARRKKPARGDLRALRNRQASFESTPAD